MALTKANNRMIDGATANILDFGADPTGVSDSSAAIQAAIDSLSNGGVVYMPEGDYLIESSILTKSSIVMQGEGNATHLVVNSDIEVIYSSRATVNTTIFQAEFRNFRIQKTVTGATTKYDIHLYNPNICHFEKVHVRSGHIDSVVSDTNKGGIWLDCSANDGGTATAFMNTVHDCWIQNNQLYLRDITDSDIVGGFYWGHTRDASIRIQGGGAIGISNIAGIVSSPYKGGIWIDNTASKPNTLIRIQNNFWDGSYASVQTGYGIYSDAGANQVSIVNNTFWACDYHQIYAIDPVGWTITGNTFFKGNDDDDSYDDIRIESKNFPASRNVVSSNAFNNDVSKTNKGYAIREVNNGGGAPTNNSYIGNVVTTTAAYLAPAINVGSGSNSSRFGNNGDFVLKEASPDGMLFGDTQTGINNFCGHTVTRNSLVSAGGTLDLTVNDLTFLGNPGGYAGFLIVTSTRYDTVSISRKTIYSVVCRAGTTATLSSIATQDGTLGGATFNITFPSNGVIRFTDTLSQQVAVNMTFVGARSLG